MIDYSYLAGMIDGEGSIYFHEQLKMRYICISTTELDLLFGCQEILDQMEIKYSVVSQKGQKENHATCYDIRIYNRVGMQKINDLCVLRSKRKKEKLESLLASYSRVVYPVRTRVRKEDVDA